MIRNRPNPTEVCMGLHILWHESLVPKSQLFLVVFRNTKAFEELYFLRGLLIYDIVPNWRIRMRKLTFLVCLR